MSKVIIAIHGLSNKPKKEQLTEWWLQSINDGLRSSSTEVSVEQFFMAYWAKHMYEDSDPKPEPYTEPHTDQKSDDRSLIVSVARDKLGGLLGRIFDRVKDLAEGSGLFEKIRDAVKERVVEDLAKYNDPTSKLEYGSEKGKPTRDVLRNTLKELITRHQDSEIMLISHSMGTIIAYDVLREIEQSPVQIARFVTMGSPLGLSAVKKTVRDEWDGGSTPLVPGSITKSWVNFSDPLDPVCADMTLAKEFRSANGVSVEDVAVSNGYNYEKDGERKHNHHKSYGYLRTDEIALHIKDFLAT